MSTPAYLSVAFMFFCLFVMAWRVYNNQDETYVTVIMSAIAAAIWPATAILAVLAACGFLLVQGLFWVADNVIKPRIKT